MLYSDTFGKSIDKVSPILFLAWNFNKGHRYIDRQTPLHVRRAAGEQDYNMGNGLHVLTGAPTACVTDAITSRHGGYYACSPTVHWPAPANDWEQPTTSEFDSLVVGCCLAMIFYSHSHHVTHVVTESLQCGVVIWDFCICNKLCIFSDSFLDSCAWQTSLNVVLVTRKGQIMKVWVQIKLNKKYR